VCTLRLIFAVIALLFGLGCAIADTRSQRPAWTVYLYNETWPVLEGAALIETGYVAPIILLTSAIQTIISSVCVSRNLLSVKHASILRWIEWIFTLPATMGLIASLCGVADIWALFGVMIASAVVASCGLMMDVFNEYKSRGEAMAWATSGVCQLLLWAVIFSHLTHLAADDTIRGIAASQFLFSFYLPVAPILRWKRGWTPIALENLYGAASLFAKIIFTIVLAAKVHGILSEE